MQRDSVRMCIVINAGSLSFHATTSKVLKLTSRVAPSISRFFHDEIFPFFFHSIDFADRANYSRKIINGFATVAIVYI